MNITELLEKTKQALSQLRQHETTENYQNWNYWNNLLIAKLKERREKDK